VAMRGFGYRDLKIFFIPFFGAAVSGKRVDVATWKQAVVSLAGPLPGIVLGCVLAILVPAPTGLVRTAILSLLIVNVFNLLPLGGLDGGQFFQRTVFSRHRYVEIAFQVITGVALLLLAAKMKTWILGIFAYLGLILIWHRARLLEAASRLRADFAGATDPSALDGVRWARLFGEARRLATPRRPPPAGTRAPPPRPRLVARTMEVLLDAMQPTPSAGVAVGLVGLWGMGLVVTAVGMFAVFGRAAPTSWHTQSLGDTGLTVEMPYHPKATVPEWLYDARGIVRLEAGFRHRYVVSVWAAGRTKMPPEPAPAGPGGEADVVPVSSGRFRGDETRSASAERVCKARILHDDAFLVSLEACAPHEEPEMDRFLTSLREAASAASPTP
jgi:hypothetical protein